jgi:hypothetical protein
LTAIGDDVGIEIGVEDADDCGIISILLMLYYYYCAPAFSISSPFHYYYILAKYITSRFVLPAAIHALPFGLLPFALCYDSSLISACLLLSSIDFTLYKGRASPPKMRFLHLEIFLVRHITSFWPNPPLKLNVTKTSYDQVSRYCPLDNYCESLLFEGEAVKPLRNFFDLYSQNS